MGLGPVEALARLTARTGLRAQDFDVIELNEAFAAQVLGCTRAWGIADDAAHINAYGGAIAMGHPLGTSGARIAGTAARRLAAFNPEGTPLPTVVDASAAARRSSA